MITTTSQNYYAALQVKEIPSLNGWRAVAILMVILGHFKVTLNEDTYLYRILDNFIFAGFGVKIFFVLSGFLITTLLIKEKEKRGTINVKNFFIRRFLRIVPVLWLYLFVVAILNQFFNFNLVWGNFIGPLLYVNNFNLFPGSWYLGHTWSLAVEEQFYLIWPFLFKLANNAIAICLSFIAITPIFKIIAYFKPHLNDYLLLPFLNPAAGIFTGALLALVWRQNFFTINIRKYLNKYLFGAIALLALLVSMAIHNGYFGMILYPGGETIMHLSIAYVITYSVLNNSNAIFRALNSKIMVTIGVLSYSLYIWQQLFLIPTALYTNWTSYFPFPINIIAPVAIAFISYHYYEKPFLKLKDKFAS